MLLLVGLGNPGDKYARNRHNIGFMAVDEIADRHNFGPEQKKFQGLLREGRIGTEKVLTLKPTTYMNESGRAVGEAMRFYKLTPDDVIVFHDELDLAPGKLRMKKSGGHAGHNGLRSIHAHIGADYRRARLGIGHPGDKSKVSGYVLNDFAKAERGWLDSMLAAMANASTRLAEDDIVRFQSDVALEMQGDPPAGKPKPPKSPKPQKSSVTDKPALPPAQETASAFDKLKGLFGR